MTSIDLTYKGLTGAHGSITGFDDTTTIDDLITAIAADEGLDTNFYTISKLGDPTDTLSITYGDSTTSIADLGFVNNDMVICTTNQVGTKEARQIQKLDIAAVKRNEIYDITRLPTQYSDNALIDNANVGGLVAHRPWVELAAGLYRRTYTNYHNDDPAFFATATQTAAGADSTLAVANTPENTSIQWLGYFVPATTETYTFFINSDDGSYLWIGATAVAGFTTGNALINNGGSHAAVELSATIALTSGVRYAIRIQTGNGGGPGTHSTSFSTPTIPKTSTFTNRIFYNPVSNGL